MSETPFSNQSPEEIIRYNTSEEAEKAGILHNAIKYLPHWQQGFFNYVTTNLLKSGYIQNNQINLEYLENLLCQSEQILSVQSKNFTAQPKNFYTGNILLPTGRQQQIFIQLNDTDKFTIMLPEDH